MRLLEQHRHLSDDRPRLGDAGDNSLPFEDLKPPLNQHVEMPGGAALANDKRARGHLPPNSPTAVVENLAHSQAPPRSRNIRQLHSCRRTDNACCMPKFSADRRWRAWHASARGGPFRNELADRLEKKLRRL